MFFGGRGKRRVKGEVKGGGSWMRVVEGLRIWGSRRVDFGPVWGVLDNKYPGKIYCPEIVDSDVCFIYLFYLFYFIIAFFFSPVTSFSSSFSSPSSPPSSPSPNKGITKASLNYPLIFPLVS